MYIDHLDNFAGYSVINWEIGDPITNLENTIYRIAIDYDDEKTWLDKFHAYLNLPNANQTRGIVVGRFSDEMYDEACDAPIQALIAAKEQLPLLDTIFINDIISEENEISWIINTDNAVLIHAYPKLKHFGTRGGNGLRFTNLDAQNLETLIVESGGLDADTLNDISHANLPKLKHLELYLGTSDYGFSGSTENIMPILQDRFNHLTYLGLKNSEIQDEITIACVNAPVLNHLQTLDLSLGVLSNTGAQALLDSADKLAHLKFLNLHYNYLTNSMVEKLEALAKSKGFAIDVSSDADIDEDDDDFRYVCIGE